MKIVKIQNKENEMAVYYYNEMRKDREYILKIKL